MTGSSLPPLGLDPSRRPPRLLIASSTEGLPYAKALQKALKPDCVCERWDEGFFKPGEYTLESLLERSGDFDGSVVVATADDRVLVRGVSAATARDNLLLEYGLFVATFGRRRALLLVEADKALALPSDLFGLTYIPFKRKKSAIKTVATASGTIKVIATQWNGEDLIDAAQQSRLNGLLELLISELRERTGISVDLGLHVFLIDRRYETPQLVRVARKRVTPKTPQRRLFPRGVGVVGACWEREEEVLADFTTESLSSQDEASWDTLPSLDRLGMSWDEFERSRKRFKAVGAVPITGFRLKAGFAGALSYNLGWQSDADVDALRTPEASRILALTAEAISAVLGHY